MHKRVWQLAFLVVLCAAPWLQGNVVIIQAEVNGSDFILVQGNRVWVEHRNFDALTGLSSRFDPSEGMPQQAVNVTLERLEGTGPVTIVEKPDASNNFTLKLLVDNDNEQIYPQQYRIRLGWQESGYSTGERIDNNAYDSLHWQGVVDGSDLLYVQGRTVNVTHIRALPIQSQSTDFSAPLPSQPTEVFLKIVAGRGTVEITQQPSLENNYTAAVRIDDGRFKSSSAYDFYLYWARQAQATGIEESDFIWEGRVDGSDVLYIQGNTVQVEHLQSQPITEAKYNFRKALPRYDQTVSLQVFDGRGSVRILEQPSRANRYTVKILLDDTQKKSAGVYRFGLRWEGGATSSTVQPGLQTYNNGGVIRWRGLVDGRDRLVFRGREVTIEHLESGPIRNNTCTFSDGLPAAAVEVKLNPISGRGDVHIVQQPSQANWYTLKVEVSDPKPGDDTYEFELTW